MPDNSTNTLQIIVSHLEGWTRLINILTWKLIFWTGSPVPLSSLKLPALRTSNPRTVCPINGSHRLATIHVSVCEYRNNNRKYKQCCMTSRIYTLIGQANKGMWSPLHIKCLFQIIFVLFKSRWKATVHSWNLQGNIKYFNWKILNF